MAFVDFFTRFDSAATVAQVEVTAVATSGEVEMLRKKTLKGAATGALTGRQGGMCPPEYEQGEVGVAFFDANGAAHWIEPVVAAGPLAKWKAAKTLKAKRKLLARLAKSKDATIQMHAAEKLKLLDEAAKAAASGWNARNPAWTSPGSERAATARLAAQWSAIRTAAPNNASLAGFDDSFAKHTCSPSASTITAKEAADQVLMCMAPARGLISPRS
jgi:hypothetical protein